MSTIETKKSRRRAFKIHPSIIKTLIHEQAGSLPKSVGELVMNSVDAGATRIDMTIDADGNFQFVDDGKGFQSLDELEQFFDTFGTPHEEGDADFGRFRCGRGQVMSYASTVWRSGNFEMRVDLDDESLESGYDFDEHDEWVSGCRITGKFYKFRPMYGAGAGEDDYQLRKYFTGLSDDLDKLEYMSEFGHLVRYAPIPVFVNGRQINKLPSEMTWEAEDDFAWYTFDRAAESLQVYNRGIFVCSYPASEFGIGGLVCSKIALRVNLARNTIVQDRCDTWKQIVEVVRNRFEYQLTKIKKLTDTEAAALLRDLYFHSRLGWRASHTIRGLRFIPDIFGKLVTPEEALLATRFTLFDGRHNGIAERVEREGLAKVIMPRMLQIANATVSEENLTPVISTLIDKLDMQYSSRAGFTIVPFEHFVNTLSDTSSQLDDSELDPEELLVLECLRDVNHGVMRAVTRGNLAGKTRKLVAGVSDTMNAWTDGAALIAVNRVALRSIRTGGPAWLITLLVHEYAHPETSAGEHHHDFEFFARFHEGMRHPVIGTCIDDLFRFYVKGLLKHGIRPSSHHGKHLRALAGYASKFPKRKKSEPTPATTASGADDV